MAYYTKVDTPIEAYEYTPGLGNFPEGFLPEGALSPPFEDAWGTTYAVLSTTDHHHGDQRVNVGDFIARRLGSNKLSVVPQFRMRSWYSPIDIHEEEP